MKIEITESEILRLLFLGSRDKYMLDMSNLEKTISSILIQVVKENEALLLTSKDKQLRDLATDLGRSTNYFAKRKSLEAKKQKERKRRFIRERCIGLTGGIATGKSTIGTLLKSMGQIVVDADQLARDVVKPGTKAFDKIVEAFGRDILNNRVKISEGIDRAKLRKIIFNDDKKRKILERITHPAIEEEMYNSVIGRKGLWFYESALLYETRFAEDIGQVWVASCDEKTQIQRLMQRDGSTEAEAKQAISIQMPVAEKAKRADVVIDTGVLLSELADAVKLEVQKVGK